jgi:hypothetical protein
MYESKRLGCGFWWLWLLATSAGMGVGWALGWALSFQAPPELASWSIGGGIGLGLGVFQGVVLRARIGRFGWWLLACFLGWGLGFVLGVRSAYWLGWAGWGFGVIVGGCAGLTSGIFQGVILSKAYDRAIWWVLGSTIAWSVGMLAYRPQAAWIGILFGAMSGSITGWMLVWLSQNQKSLLSQAARSG